MRIYAHFGGEAAKAAAASKSSQRLRNSFGCKSLQLAKWRSSAKRRKPQAKFRFAPPTGGAVWDTVPS